MKKLFALLTLCLSFISVNAQTNAVVAWNGVTDPSVAGYNYYYKIVSVTQYSSNQVVGATITNATMTQLQPYTVYQGYVTSYATNGLESLPSNQIRYEYFFVNATKPTALTLSDVGTTNFPSFQLVQNPTNGVVTGTPPNVVFTPSAGFTGRDKFAYRSPEIFSGQNLTNYYSVYSVQLNPPTIISVTPN